MAKSYRSKLRKAVRLAAADLLEPGLHEEVRARLGSSSRARFGRSGVAGELTREGRALLDEPGLVVVGKLDDPDLEAAYYMRRDTIVLSPELVRESVDAIREALLEEALHRCLWRAGLRDERRHHEIIAPVLEAARGL